LFICQRAGAVLKSIAVEAMNQPVIAAVRCGIQPVAVGQIAQNFQVWNLIEQAGVPGRIQFDVIYQLAIDFTIASFDDFGAQDGINEDLQFLDFQLAKVQTVYDHAAAM